MDVSEIFREHGSRLILYAQQLCAGRAEAEELVQDVLVACWRAQPEVREALPYLYRAVRNAAGNQRRGRQRRERAEAARREDAQLFVAPSRELEEEEFRRGVEQALAELPVEQRELIVLRVWSELPYREIAEVLAAPEGTLKSRYNRALESLRHRLRAEVEE